MIYAAPRLPPVEHIATPRLLYFFHEICLISFRLPHMIIALASFTPFLHSLSLLTWAAPRWLSMTIYHFHRLLNLLMFIKCKLPFVQWLKWYYMRIMAKWFVLLPEKITMTEWYITSSMRARWFQCQEHALFYTFRGRLMAEGWCHDGVLYSDIIYHYLRLAEDYFKSLPSRRHELTPDTMLTATNERYKTRFISLLLLFRRFAK